MKKIAMVLGMVMGFAAVAGELDLPNGQKLPTGLVVRIDNNGNSQVFTTDSATAVQNDAEAQAVIEAFAKDANAVQVATTSELDANSSRAAWYYGCYYNCGYNYGYNYSYNYNYYYSYYGYNYYYRPCYNYNYGGYNWNYYRY